MIFLSPELWGNYNCSWKLQLWLEKTKALLEKTSLSVTIGPTTVKLVNIELKKTLSNAEKRNPLFWSVVAQLTVINMAWIVRMDVTKIWV